MKTLLSGKQLDLHKLTVQDKGFPAGSGILIEGDEATVTNGKYLVTVKNTSKAQADDFPQNGVTWKGKPSRFLLDAQTAKDARKTIPKGKHLPSTIKHAAIGMIDKDGETVPLVQTTDYQDFNNYEPVDMGNRFPNTKEKGIIPDFRDESKYQRIGIDASYLVAILKELQTYRKDKSIVTLYLCKKDKKIRGGKRYPSTVLKAEHQPMAITAQDDDLENEAMAIIMPVRL